MGNADDYESNDNNARHSRAWTHAKPLFYLVFAVAFAGLHHWLNSKLHGTAVISTVLQSIDIPLLDRSIKLSQKHQHWVLNIFAFLYKSCLVRSMSCGLLQHAWKSLQTSSLNVRQIDCVVALQHRKPSGFLSFKVLTSCFPTVILSFLSITIPYSAIFPSGSLTVVEINGISVYNYNPRWLVGPYVIGLVITFITILAGTHALHYHNTSNLSFSFSHILAVTRNEMFDEALKDAKRHHIPYKVMEGATGCKNLRLVLVAGKEVFAEFKDPNDPEKNASDNTSDNATDDE